MKWKLLLVVLLVSVGAGLYLAREMGLFKPESPERPESEKLMNFPLQAVETLSLSFNDTTFKLRRKYTGWVIEAPYPGEMADSMTVNSLLRTLNQIAVRKKIPVDSISLTQINLDRPSLSFRMEFTDGRSSGVDFGVLNPTTDNIYARRADADSVILFGKIMSPTLGLASQMVRGKQLIDLDPLRVFRITLDSGGNRSLFVMDSVTGRWWMESSSGRVPVDKRSILVLLEKLRMPQVREFHPVDAASAAQTGLDKPILRLILEDLDGKRNELNLGRNEAERKYLLWSSSSTYPATLLLVDSLVTGYLDRLEPKKIFYTRLVPIDIHRIDRIGLKYRRLELELVADNDTLWRLVRPKEFKARLWRVESLLTQVDTMTALRILPGMAEDRGFSDPQLDMGLYHGDSLLGRYLVGDYTGLDIYFRDVGRGMDFVVPSKTMERLSWTYDDLADVPVMHVVE